MSFSINIDSLLKSLLISGASGFLGSHLYNFFSKKDEFKTFGLIRSSSDLSRINSKNLKNLFVIDQTDFEHIFKKYRIEVVINTVCNYGRKNESEQSLINSNYLFGKKLVEISNKPIIEPEIAFTAIPESSIAIIFVLVATLDIL